MDTKPSDPRRATLWIVGGYACTRELWRDWAAQEFSTAQVGVAAEAADLPRRVERGVVVALIDIDLPGTAGLELVRRVRGRLPAARLVALSAYFADAHRDHALAAGADACVSPQVTDGGLRDLVGPLLREGSTP